MMEEWQPAEKVQKNESTGEYRALVNGQWVPVTKAQKNEETGKYRVVFAAAEQPMAEKPNSVMRGIKDTPYGAAQLLSNYVLPDAIEKPIVRLNDWLGRKIGMKPGAGETIDERVRNEEQSYQQQRAAAGETGFDWGRLTGNVISPANLAIASKIPQGVTLLGKIGYGGAAGTTFGALQPATSESPENYSSEKALQALMGGVFGAGTSAATQAGSWAWNQIRQTKAMTNPEGRKRIVEEAIRRWAGKDKPDIVNALDDQRNYDNVPGSPATSADVIASGNLRTMEGNNPRMFGRQVVAAQEGLSKNADVTSDLASDTVKQQAARMKHLESVIPDEQAAVNAREEATKALYEKANGSIVPIAGKMQGYLLRIPPEVLRQANKAAAITGDQFVVGGKLPSHLSGKQMHYIKMALDDAITTKNNPGMTATVQRNMSKLRDEMLATYENQNPIYGQARQAYREMSGPVNQASVLKAMKAELEKPGGGERIGPFMNVLGKGEAALLKRSTGMPRYQNGDLDKILTPDQLKAVMKISGELEREVKINQILSKSTAHNAGKEAEAGMVEFPRVLEQNLVIANYFLGKAKDKIIPEMNQMAADILRDPKKLNDVLKHVPKARVSEVVKRMNEAAGISRAHLPAISTVMEERKR